MDQLTTMNKPEDIIEFAVESLETPALTKSTPAASGR